MNERSNKKIFFNKSTLISLKAELLKKQEEVNEKKQLPQNRIENYKPPPPKPSVTSDDISKIKKTFKESLTTIDTEELEACKKSKAALEKKAELYEHLSDSAGNSQLAGHFLVDFNNKKQSETTREVSLVLEPEDREEHEDNSEWTEFTDCLGRTRKCLKIDLDLYLEKDKELRRIMNIEQPGDDATGDTEETIKPEKPLLVQTTNDYLQSLRAKWEEKERELLAKDKDIHYQDVLFDEARLHGVAYFSFSTDEVERRKQMEDLMKQRDETLKAQKDAAAKRKIQNELLASRVAAARARQRMRAGLPPEDPEEQKKDFTTCLLEFLTQQKNEAEAKAKEEEKKLREEKEKEKQKMREAYVREWDIGKDGVNEKKRFREMSQEEYVEQQRAKRMKEFAPPQTVTSSKSDYTFDDKGRKIEQTESPVPSKSWADVRPKLPTLPPLDTNDYVEQKGLYFSTAKNTSESKVLYRHFVKAQEPTPIINEVGENSEKFDDRTERTPEDKYAEVGPPPTYDYYGPVAKRSQQRNPFESDLMEAYEQGVQSLSKQPSKLKLSKHYDFSMD